MKHILILFSLLFLRILSVFSQNAIDFNTQNLDVIPFVNYFTEEENKPLQLPQVLDSLKNGAFVASNTQRSLNFGTNSNPIWVHFKIKSQEELEMVLHYASTYIYYIDLYEKNENQNWQLFSSTGKKRDLKTRGDLKPKDFAWRIHFKQGETKEILLRSESKSIMLIPLSIQSVDYYITSHNNTYLLYGLYFGVLIIMMLYNFIIYISLREKAYLYYVISIFCTIIVFASSNGFSTKYFFPNSWQMSYNLAPIFMCVLVAPTTLFATSFLDLKKYSKFSYYLMLALASISIPSAVIVQVFELTQFASSLVALLAVSLLSVGAIAFFKKNPFAIYYVMAWFFYLVGGVFVTLRNLGHLPSTIITDNGAEIGSAIEVCLLAFALANKYRKIRQEKNQLQKEYIALIETKKEELEVLVTQRTIKLNETIEELNATLNHVNEQQIELAEKNRNITSSINYALKIQEAILPNQTILSRKFNDYFQLYLPKDIVSGDFIFYIEDENVKYFVVADCTGHGVPGAIMTMLGYNILYEIIKVHHIKSGNEILEQLDFKLSNRLRHNHESQINDGMELSLIIIDKVNNKMLFSGAANSLLAIKTDGTTQLIKGTKRSIGDTERKIPFEQHYFNPKDISWIYMYSDGYQDQFGEEGTKFFSKRLRDLLSNNAHLSGKEQQQLLFNTFKNWKGCLDQIDDVTVVGIKL